MHLLHTLTPYTLLFSPCAGDLHADSVAVGTTVACVAFLLLITLMAASCYFFHKITTVKKGVPVVSSWSWQCYPSMWKPIRYHFCMGVLLIVIVVTLSMCINMCNNTVIICIIVIQSLSWESLSINNYYNTNSTCTVVDTGCSPGLNMSSHRRWVLMISEYNDFYYMRWMNHNG